MATLFRMDGWVKSVLGNAISGAQIYVCTQPVDASFLPPIPLASVFSDVAGASPVVQPIITDGFGFYSAYMASGTPYSIVVVNQGKLQQVYADQVPMGATLGPLLPAFTGDPTQFLNGTGVFSVPAGGGGGAVASVFGRTGIVVAQVSDYSAFYAPIGSVGAVSSVFGRTGAVVATTNDYSEAQLSFTNITTNNVSTTKHGFVPILPNDATKFLNGTGAYSVPSGSSFPLTIVQEAAFTSGTSNVTSYTVTFPTALAGSGNTAFMLVACDGSSVVTVPTGWTKDLDSQQGSFARFILTHKTTAGDTTATFTVGSASTFSVYFFEVTGSHTLDQSSIAGVANTNNVILPAITPTVNSVVFGMACAVNGAAAASLVFVKQPIKPNWNTIDIAVPINGGRTLIGHVSGVAAANVLTTPPIISFPNVALLASGGVAYATFSIL